jgi:uncharacterized membrane protein YedE/YeeE
MTAAGCGVRCRVMSLVLAGLAGALFGAGLLISGMTEPARVIGFLTVSSRWDPSLGFVMAGAVAVYAVLFRWIRRRRSDPWFDASFYIPIRRAIDRPLLVGAALFGIGWGLGGLCPGPSIVSAASGSAAGLAFVAAMLVGMHLQHRSTR